MLSPVHIHLVHFGLTPGTIRHQLLIDLAIITVFFMLGYLLHLKARIEAERTFDEQDLRVPFESRSVIGTALRKSTRLIQTWNEDALGRAALVDSISIKLMIAKSPVLALFGEFGSGKTSILNLLREHLEKKTIVVSFSTWLPGSEDTLISYLLADITSECQKQYVVPGLRKSAQRFASALAQSVPRLKGFPELLPPGTQRDDIESVKVALERLPKRVIVLLDELDRMAKAEVLTLLKVIRGISALPNLSFVCASDRETLERTVKALSMTRATYILKSSFLYRFRFPKLMTMRCEKPEWNDWSLSSVVEVGLTMNLRRNPFANRSTPYGKNVSQPSVRTLGR